MIDSSAVLWSAPERERAGRPLLVLLHGYGSHEGDLFSLAPGLPLGPVVASLRAPLRAGAGNAWFPLSADTAAADMEELTDTAARAVLDWIDTTESTQVGILGFSQGGATALQVLRLAPERIAYTVMLSGFVVGSNHPGDAALAAVRPPVFWGRGTTDRVIPGPAIDWTALWLPKHAETTTRVYEDVAHGISRDELTDVSRFISAHL